MGYLYPIEILPFGLRAKGHALSQTCVFMALFFNQFVSLHIHASLACRPTKSTLACMLG